MAKLLKLRRGTTTQHASFTGAEGELTVDITKDTAVVHDGSQAGGKPLAREDMSNVSSSAIVGRIGSGTIGTDKLSAGGLPANVTVHSTNIVDGTIVNADVNASAAIAGTKISPDFGSQNITTTGSVSCANATLSGELNLMGTEATKYMDFNIGSNLLALRGTTGGETGHTNMATFARTGATTLNFNGSPKIATASGGIGVTGNMTVTGTVDGRDVAADGTKLDTYEANGSSYVRSDADDQLYGQINFNNTGANPVVIGNTSGDNAQKLLIRGAASPYIQFRENNTDKASIQWHSDGFFRINNEEDGSQLRIQDDIKFSQDGSTFHKVWHAGNDGAGSGLDADFLDGKTSGSFLDKDGDTADGDINFNGGAGAVTIASNSDIRFTSGTWTGEHSCKIQHHSGIFYFQGGSNGHQFRTNSGGAGLSIDASGNCTASGNVTAYSDRRLKTDIHTINDALGICGKLRGVSYKWIADGKASIGVIAQEVEEVIPEIVLTNQDVNPVTQEITEVKSVDYGKIVGVLINAINELKAEVDELKGGK